MCDPFDIWDACNCESCKLVRRQAIGRDMERDASVRRVYYNARQRAIALLSGASVNDFGINVATGVRK